VIELNFRLILDCKVENAQIISDYVKKSFSSNYVVITDNRLLKNELDRYGISAQTIFEIIPTDSDQEIDAYERAHIGAESIKRDFSKVTHNGIEISAAFTNKIRAELEFLEIINFVLKSKKEFHVLICREYTSYYYFAYHDLASNLGYHISSPMSIKNDEISPIDPLTVTEHKLILKTLSDIGSTKKKDVSLLHKIFRNKNTSISPRLDITKGSCIFLVQTNTADLYLRPVYPVIEEFQHRHHPFVVMTADWRAAENLKQKKINFIDFSSHLEKTSLSDTGIIRQALLSIRDIAIRKDNSIVTILCKYLLNDAFYNELVQNLKAIVFFEEIISETKPESVLVMPSGIDLSDIMCAVAKRNKIRTITIIAASVTASRRSILSHNADYIASYGEECNEAFIKMGYDKNRLILTGNAFFDKIKKIKISEAQVSLTKVMKLDFDIPIILIATSGLDKNESFWMYETIKYANKKNYQVIVKVHPDKKISDFVHLQDNPDKLHFHLIQNVDILELLSISNLVITDYSNVGLLAILFDKPLMIANLMGKPFPNNRYDELKVALLATSIEDIVLKLDRILRDKQTQDELRAMRKKYEHYYNYKNDGMAASRIYELLTKTQI